MRKKISGNEVFMHTRIRLNEEPGVVLERFPLHHDQRHNYGEKYIRNETSAKDLKKQVELEKRKRERKKERKRGAKKKWKNIIYKSDHTKKKKRRKGWNKKEKKRKK